jgi:hypothetical protein
MKGTRRIQHPACLEMHADTEATQGSIQERPESGREQRAQKICLLKRRHAHQCRVVERAGTAARPTAETRAARRQGRRRRDIEHHGVDTTAKAGQHYERDLDSNLPERRPQQFQAWTLCLMHQRCLRRQHRGLNMAVTTRNGAPKQPPVHTQAKEAGRRCVCNTLDIVDKAGGA